MSVLPLAGGSPLDPTTIDWAAVDPKRLPFRFRQEPGPANALGRVKFLFPNRWNVYLHDTASRGLFARADRDLSHGCVRVEKPTELAQWLLEPDERARVALAAAFAGTTERTVLVRPPVPIHILYWTAWSDGRGTVHFRPDVYGRDPPLERALEAAAPSPPASG